MDKLEKDLYVAVDLFTGNRESHTPSLIQDLLKIIEGHTKRHSMAFVQWLQENDWQPSRDKANSFDKRAGNLIHGRIVQTISLKKAYSLFKESLTDNQ